MAIQSLQKQIYRFWKGIFPQSKIEKIGHTSFEVNVYVQKGKAGAHGGSPAGSPGAAVPPV